MSDRVSDRVYDVVLYGASGFVGRQTVEYFARHAPSELRWAIAGRDRQKLEAVRDRVGVSVDVLVADSQDQAAVAAIAAQTRIVLTTAGPFARHGEALVAACVRHKTHYVDITGETPWVRSLIDRYHAQAAADGTRIIPFCGFDSVPSDLGTYLVVRHMQRERGLSCQQVKAAFQGMGGFNGGTLASAFNLYDSGGAAQYADPFLLSPDTPHDTATIQRSQDPDAPAYDADLETWVAPFFMGPVNTRVVRRSHDLFTHWQASYGEDFTYQEYFKAEEPLGWFKAVSIAAGTGLMMGAIQQPVARSLLQPLFPKPGEGPSEETMNAGWFSCDLVGIAADGRRVRGTIRGQGDPGNRATVKFLCESALSLALETDALPGGTTRGGILTPATGLGEVLAKRLQHAGMTLEVGAD